MDLSPFQRINPCGYQGMEMVQVSQLGGPDNIEIIGQNLIDELVTLLDYKQVEITKESILL